MKKCKYIVGQRKLGESQLEEYQQSLKIDPKFSPIQLSDVLKKDYYDVLESTEQEAINKLAPKDIATIEVVDDVKLFHYRNESNPNWSALNGNESMAKQALLKDREVVGTYYQLDKGQTETVDKDTETKLKSFINTQGFEASVITEFEKSQKANGREFTVKGWVDLMDKVVKYDEQSLPEEAFTLARAMYVKDDSSIYDLVRQHPMYEKVKQDYKGIYKTELEFAKEALDKLGAENIIRKANTVDGRLMTRLKRIWERFVNWAKGNTELQSFLDEMTANILNDSFVGIKNEDVTGRFYQIETNDIKFDSKEEELLYKGITSLKQRLSGLYNKQVGKKIGLNLREKIDLLEQDLENKQYDLGLTKLLKYFNEDSKAALVYIKDVQEGKRVVDSKQLKYLGEFIDYYFPVLTQLRSSINRGDIKNNGRIDIIREELSRFDDINDFYTDNMAAQAESFVGEEIGEKTNTDINMATYLFGSLRDVPDQILRKVHVVVSKILKNVQNVVYELGKDLVLSFDGDFNTEKFREKINGKKTHYFLSQYKLGPFYEEYDNFVTKLRSEYGITSGLPVDRQQRIEYNRKLNEWKSKNIERKFVAEYYDLFNSLSLQTVLAKESYDLAIRNILLEVTNSNNQIEFDKLTDEQYEELQQLESDRKGLANLYHFDGTKKEGTDLEIALELKSLYDVLKDKLESVKFTKAFQQLLSQKRKQVEDGTMTDTEYKKWFERVSTKEYDKKFYEELEVLDSYDYGLEYEQLKEEKNELLKRYRDSELKIDADLVNPEIHKRVFEIEQRMDEIRKADKSKKPKSDFDKVASVEKTQQYHDEISRQKSLGEEQYKKWVGENHVGGKPISIWTQIVPKKKEYIHIVPKRYWAETSEESPWYNKNFNPNWKGMQPTNKWNNPEHDKLTNKEKENLKNLIDLKNQGDDIYKTGSRNYYQLPQISKSTMDVFTSDNKMDNMKELISEGFVDKIDDDQFGEIETRADGSQIKYIPRYYTKQLEKPDFISDDLIRTVIKYRAAAEKYKQMGEVAPDLELVMEAIGQRRFVGKRKALSGKETNTYKTLKGFIDHQVYAIQQEPMGYFKLFGKDINTSKLLTKLEKYIRDKNLVFNLFTTVTAYTTASINSKIEDLVGTYTDQRSKLFAEREYMRNVTQMLSETDKAIKTNRLSLVMEKLGFLEDPFNDLDKSRLARLASSTPYGSYGLVSHRIKTKIALAMMSHYRVVDGQLVTQKQLNNDVKWKSLSNIYDMFKIEKGKATIPKELQEVFADLQLKIEFVANRVDGALSTTDKGAAHRHAFLQLLTTHRGWLFSGIQNRAKQRGLNEITGEYEIGYYRGWFDFLKTSFMKPNRMALLKNMIERWGELETYEKLAVMRTMYEIGMAVAVGIVAMILNNIADDEDEDDFRIQFLSYIANRTLLETSVFPSVATGMLNITSIEASSILNSPIAATNTLESLGDLLYLLSDEEISKGTHEGLTKSEKAIIKLTPGLRGYWASRNPHAANQFLKMKSLRWIY